MRHVQPPPDGEVLPDNLPLLAETNTSNGAKSAPANTRRGRTLERRRLDGLGTSPSIRS